MKSNRNNASGRKGERDEEHNDASSLQPPARPSTKERKNNFAEEVPWKLSNEQRTMQASKDNHSKKKEAAATVNVAKSEQEEATWELENEQDASSPSPPVPSFKRKDQKKGAEVEISQREDNPEDPQASNVSSVQSTNGEMIQPGAVAVTGPGELTNQRSNVSYDSTDERTAHNGEEQPLSLQGEEGSYVAKAVLVEDPTLVDATPLSADDYKRFAGEQQEQSNPNKRKWICIGGLIVVVILGAIGAVVGVLLGGSGGGDDQPNVTPSPTTLSAVEQFCSDFSGIEAYLSQSLTGRVFYDLPITVTSDGYDCGCVSQDPLQFECFLTYTFPDSTDTFINSEKALFFVKDGNYVPFSVGWCETIEGNSEYEGHCETFVFCNDNDNSVCSCSTDDDFCSGSCEICPGSGGVALNCSANPYYSVITTCNDDPLNTGAFLANYDFPEIPA